MSEDGLDVMRRWFELWNRGDLDAFADLFAADSELIDPQRAPDAGQAGDRQLAA